MIIKKNQQPQKLKYATFLFCNTQYPTDVTVSQDSVAKRLRCDEKIYIYYYLLLSVPVKECWKCLKYLWQKLGGLPSGSLCFYVSQVADVYIWCVTYITVSCTVNIGLTPAAVIHFVLIDYMPLYCIAPSNVVKVYRSV